MIRVRFAPSPTGYLHIGGVRTALFNFLYARAQGGQFLLRIEDTDRERSTPEFEANILQAMEWLGLSSDETVIYQSRRLDKYKAVADELVQKGLAVEEIKDGKRAVRFTMPKKKAVFHDLVHGETAFDTSLFDDLVILKSDGYPTYHLACVVDDHEMEISHVIRGDDHLSNTPRQIMLFEALGWKPPKYAHLPLILGGDGSPLSKRHGAVALSAYKEEGYLSEGLLNYLALLGWGPEGNQEIFSLKELTEKFSLKRITKSNARFDLEKLQWLNAQHIKKLADDEYVSKISAFLAEEARSMEPQRWRMLVLLFKARIKTFKDLTREASYCFQDISCDDTTAIEEVYRKAGSEINPELWGRVSGLLQSWLKRAITADFADIQGLEALTRQTAEDQKIAAKEIIHPLRFALAGKTVSPGLFELMNVLGKDLCLLRVEAFIHSLKSRV
ncbi:MAG: glutamate--tRNA ligase [Candidatus Omnitrophica bacterium]|nr:glutamate--tRNA ligase [Candidatus Omnitrophota bacterium]